MRLVIQRLEIEEDLYRWRSKSHLMSAAVEDGVATTEGGDGVPSAVLAADEGGCGVVEAPGVRAGQQV
jgi:hypothetical protein